MEPRLHSPQLPGLALGPTGNVFRSWALPLGVGSIIGVWFGPEAGLATLGLLSLGLSLKAAAPGAEPTSQRSPGTEPPSTEALQSAAAAAVPPQAEAPAPAPIPIAPTTLLAELAPEITGALKGIGRLAGTLAESDLTLAQRDLVDTISGSSATLSHLLGDVLDLARIDAGRLKLRRRDFQLANVTDQLSEELMPLAWRRGLELSIELAPELADWHWGDDRRLTQLLGHLLRGCLTNTDRGEVRLLVLPAVLVGESKGPLRFEIHDSAPVHTRAAMLRLLERAPSSVENLAELDLSLGLLLARGLVDVMGGRMGNQPKPEGGNLFWIELPLEATRGPKQQLSADTSTLLGRKLLVVEARAAARATLVNATRRLGLIVEEAEGFDPAFERLQAAQASGEAFEVVLVDDELQGGRGRELAQRVARERQDGKPTVVLLTPAGRPQDPARLVELGVDAWIPKPVRVQRLTEALLHVCRAEHRSPRPLVGAKPAAVAQLAQPTDVAGTRVLLLAEEQSSRRLLQHCLRQAEVRTALVESLERLPERFSDGVYDLVLIDSQEPAPSRLAALSQLRAIEVSSGTRVRLVALADPETYSAELEIWLEAGADLCLPRPRVGTDFEALIEVLLGLGQPSSSGPASPIEKSVNPLSAMQNSEQPLLDLEVVQSLKELGGAEDPGLFAELVDMFLRDTPARIQAMLEALHGGDPVALARAAHSMKSSCGNLGAISLASLCQAIEVGGRQGNVDAVRSLVQRSAEEYQLVAQALRGQL
jgi:CheY-like chemotaxis protein